MTREQKLAIIKRNFMRMCEACKIDTATMLFHIDEHYHGTLQYIRDQSDPCIVVCKIHKTITEFINKKDNKDAFDSAHLN